MSSFDLERFVTAQDASQTYAHALAELRAGRKTSHWMWFVFPQLAGLGQSAMAKRYAISSLEEARAYADHPVLGPRLFACVAAIQALPPTSAVAIFGSVDAMKLHSSLTLFARSAPEQECFSAALTRYFGGTPDAATLELLGAEG
jgi:uncharacterized protein (DUF1810 family)